MIAPLLGLVCVWLGFGELAEYFQVPVAVIYLSFYAALFIAIVIAGPFVERANRKYAASLGPLFLPKP